MRYKGKRRHGSSNKMKPMNFDVAHAAFKLGYRPEVDPYRIGKELFVDDAGGETFAEPRYLRPPWRMIEAGTAEHAVRCLEWDALWDKSWWAGKRLA